MALEKFTLTRPDDWHLHVRDGASLTAVARFSARQFARCLIMPNLAPPVATVADALAYRERILAAVGTDTDFTPLMALYLTPHTRPSEIANAAATPQVVGVKLYPAGATTHSNAGVSDMAKTYDTLAAMEEHGLPLLVHGESTDPSVDVFDREAVFIDKVLDPLLQRFPRLRLVLEHITTRDGVAFVRQAPPQVAATITPQHLLLNRNALFQGGIRPHHFCLPVLKREIHRQALLEAATSGSPKFFLGTDSAPHARSRKETSCGCAGIFSAHAAIELYAEAFEQADALEKLEGFASFFGADYYGLPRNLGKITLTKAPWDVPASYAFGDEELVPMRAGEKIQWKMITSP